LLTRLVSSTLFPYTTLFRSIGLSISRNSSCVYWRRRKCQANETQFSVCAKVVRRDRAVRDPLSSHGSQKRSNRDPGHVGAQWRLDRKSTRLNSSHVKISYAV